MTEWTDTLKEVLELKIKSNNRYLNENKHEMSAQSEAYARGKLCAYHEILTKINQANLICITKEEHAKLIRDKDVTYPNEFI